MAIERVESGIAKKWEFIYMKDYDEDGTSSYYSEYSQDAQPLFDIAQVSWIEQPSREWLPWQWYLDEGTNVWD